MILSLYCYINVLLYHYFTVSLFILLQYCICDIVLLIGWLAFAFVALCMIPYCDLRRIVGRCDLHRTTIVQVRTHDTSKVKGLCHSFYVQSITVANVESDTPSGVASSWDGCSRCPEEGRSDVPMPRIPTRGSRLPPDTRPQLWFAQTTGGSYIIVATHVRATPTRPTRRRTR